MEYLHTPILVTEICDFLNIKEDSIIVDCTTGEGGHSLVFAKKNPKGRMLCIDQDPNILAKAKKRLEYFSHISFFNTNFLYIDQILSNQNISHVDGILADLGVSMFHFKEAKRGFSFFEEEELDMRLGDQNIKAIDIVNHYEYNQIADILYNFGQEHFSRQIATAILKHRPIKNAKHLADIIKSSYPHQKGHIHPATKSFQALRIFVNEELSVLEQFLPKALDSLADGGRLCILTFHSLEDKIVKDAFKSFEISKKGRRLTKKPLSPSESEKKQNPASRSAHLRVFEKSIDIGA